MGAWRIVKGDLKQWLFVWGYRGFRYILFALVVHIIVMLSSHLCCVGVFTILCFCSINVKKFLCCPIVWHYVLVCLLLVVGGLDCCESLICVCGWLFESGCFVMAVMGSCFSTLYL